MREFIVSLSFQKLHLRDDATIMDREENLAPYPFGV